MPNIVGQSDGWGGFYEYHPPTKAEIDAMPPNQQWEALRRDWSYIADLNSRDPNLSWGILRDNVTAKYPADMAAAIIQGQIEYNQNNSGFGGVVKNIGSLLASGLKETAPIWGTALAVYAGGALAGQTGGTAAAGAGATEAAAGSWIGAGGAGGAAGAAEIAAISAAELMTAGATGLGAGGAAGAAELASITAAELASTQIGQAALQTAIANAGAGASSLGLQAAQTALTDAGVGGTGMLTTTPIGSQSTFQPGSPYYTDANTLPGLTDGSAFIPGDVAAPSFLGQIGDAAKAGVGMLKDVTGLTGGQLAGTALNLGAGYLQNKAATEAAQTQANAQIEAARIAADAAKFRPVGVSTRFGKSKFGFDAQGNLSEAGYELSPEMKAQQDRMMTMSGRGLSQYEGAMDASAPMGTAAQSMFQLGQGYLGTSPQAQAQQYMREQQALLAAGRERDFSQLQNTMFAQGRGGFAMGGTSTGMGAANPQLEAFYNAQRQQDLALAAQATQGGMDYSRFGAGMVGAGGQMLRDQYGTQTAAYNPYQTALGGATYAEGLGQQALDYGINIGAKGTAATAQSGMLLGRGMEAAAQLRAGADARSPWATILGTGAQAFAPQQQQQAYDQRTGTWVTAPSPLRI